MSKQEGDYDVAVIGAGVMGASTALFLARGGMRCVLIDRKGICAEASGINAGTLTLHMTRAALIPYAQQGWRMWTQAQDWLGCDPGVTTTAGLSLAFTDAEMELLRQRAAARQAMGAQIELVGRERAREIEPGLSEHVHLAAHCAVDGHITANFVGRAFQGALTASGVACLLDWHVKGIEREKSSFVVHSYNRYIHARRIVLAGGVWLEQMLSWLDVHIPIKALINQLIITERVRPVMRTVLSIANGLLSLKQFANGTVLIGGGWQGKGDRNSHTTEIIPENIIGNVRLAQYAIPALQETRIVRTWLGFEAETADAMPMLGELPGVADAFVIGSVHSGFTSGPYMGKLLAQFILEQGPEMPLSAFDPKRLIVTEEVAVNS